MSEVGWKAFSICVLARLLEGRRHVLVGTNAPAPSAAALLARELADDMRVTIIGSRRHSAFADDLAEGFDRATQGRFDAFFSAGGQIDGAANLNLVGLGAHPRLDVRWSGSHGQPLFYMMIPNIILFKEEHTRATLVSKVDFISASGVSPPDVHRPGGPCALVTARCVFSFDRQRGRFTLASVHPGHTVEEIVENTGFDFDRSPAVPSTPSPSARALDVLRERIAPELQLMYPQYTAGLMAELAQLAPAS